MNGSVQLLGKTTSDLKLPDARPVGHRRMSSCTEWLHRIALVVVAFIVLILLGCTAESEVTRRWRSLKGPIHKRSGNTWFPIGFLLVS